MEDGAQIACIPLCFSSQNLDFMTSALIHASGPKGIPTLAQDLAAAGIEVLAIVEERNKVVQHVLRHAPDLLICDAPQPAPALFAALQVIAQTAPCPVIVFTSDASFEAIDLALESGVHAYEVNAYGAGRLRGLIHLAQVRFKREQTQRTALVELTTRFEERKAVDRAKGILMRAREVTDDEAFQILRTASMHSNQRLGQVSEQIIHSAHFAQAVNRAGQLRMLSQRLVKLHGLQLSGVAPAQCAQQFQESVQRIDAHLAHLGKSLSQPTYGDLLAQVVQTWARLMPALTAGAELQVVDDGAEQLLQGAERLTASLESAGVTAPLRVLNMAGRQRMLSQRFAKYAVLQALALPGDASLAARCATGMSQAQAAFEQALTELNALPLSSAEIDSALQTAGTGWLQMLAAARVKGQEGLTALATASEDLLTVFEHLSTYYERSMQVLTGS